MRWLKPLATVLASALLGALLTSAPRLQEAPWRETGWTGAFAVPRPTLPGQKAFLEAAGPIPVGIRVRIHRVEDPQAFLARLLALPPGEPSMEGRRAGSDPLDILREAFLWGGRRAFVTVHRTASRALRDTARGTDGLRAPLQQGRTPREGDALALEGQPGITLVSEIVPRVTEEITKQPGARDAEEDGEDRWGGPGGGHLSRIELPAEPAGVYLLEVIRGADAAYVPWLVTDLALLGDQDGSRLRVLAVDARDGSPRGGVAARIYDGKAMSPLGLDGQGRGECPAGPGTRRVVLASSGPSFALLALEGQASASVRQRIYAYTERPLYRPGQEVFVKAILRGVEDGENRVVPGVRELPFTVLDPEDTKVAEGKATLLQAETGTYGAHVTLPGAGRLGTYRWVFEGPSGPAQAEFKVEQFVKPAYAVEVTTPAGKVGLGDSMAFDVKARYFYGAAVRKAKAEWFLYKVVPRRASFWFDEEDEGPAPELVESGELELGEDGTARSQAFKAAEEVLYRFVVKVTDGSGQRNSGSAQVRASAGDLVLLVGADRAVAAPGKPFQVAARAVDLEGHEVKGVPIALRAARVVAEKEGNAWWTRVTALRPGETVASAQGPKGALVIPEGGVYLVLAEARDSRGRPVTAQCLVTVAAEGTPLPAVADLRATADKGEYRPGETARILVQLPRPRLTLHWTLENEALGRRESRFVSGTTTVVEVPVTAALQPNAWAVFEIVADGRRQQAEVPIRAPRTDRRLQVEVRTDRDAYQPGQAMKVLVQVKDDQGRPARADVSVGVVDEAIYALQPEFHPDIVRFFNPTRRHSVTRTGSTEWSFWDILRRQRPVWALKQTRRGEFKSDDADRIRQNFKDTAHWVPFLAAGRDGTASTDLVLPDNLTAWRATATAVTSDTKAGVGRARRPSSKPLQVSLTLPRTLSLGEEGRAIAQVRNLSGHPIQGKVWLEVRNGRLDGQASQAFDLQDQGEHRISLPLGTEATGALAVTVHVEGGGLKDAERRSVTVVDPLVPASVSGYLNVQGGPESVAIPVPPGATGAASLVVVPVASLEQLAAPSLPYLISYPYGCVEQTLSSFMPNILVADLVKQGKMPALDWKKLVDLDRNIRDGVFRIYGYQQPNGGWGWYAPQDFGMDSNPHTTGYAIQSLATMKRLGYPVDEGAYRRGVQAAFSLFRQCAQQADAPPSTERKAGRAPDPAGDAAFLLQALASTGEPVHGMVDSTAAKVLKGAWRGQHVLAMTTLAAVLSRDGRAGELLDRMEREAIQKGGLAHWEGDRRTWWDYDSGEITPTVMALKALAAGRPASALLPQGEAFLATRYQGYGWYSTWTTSGVLELLPYLARIRPLAWNPSALQASVQGGPSWDFTRETPKTSVRWNSKEPRPGYLALDAPRPVILQASGRGVLVWTYAYQVRGGASAPQAAEASGALRLSLGRRLWRLRTPQQTGDAARGWVRAPWTGQLAVGEEAWMELTVSGDREANYAVLEVPIPAGLDPSVKLEGFVLEGHPFTEEGVAESAWNRPRIEVHPDRVAFFWPRLYPWENQTVRILLRAGMAGSYRLRPAKLSLMSNEGQWTTCEGLPLVVKEGGAR
jgi:alpha-2-macroglobulin